MKKGGNDALLALVVGDKKSGGGGAAMSSEEEAEAAGAYSKTDYDAGDASFDAFAAALSKGDNAKAKKALKQYIHSCIEADEE